MRASSASMRPALAMPGVKAMLTADELPPPADTLTDNGTVIRANPKSERGLTMEPLYQGEPILAVAAIDELTAAEAIERIEIDLEPLPFVVDPLDTLRPGGPNPRTDGNIWVQPPPPTAEAGAPPPPADPRSSSGPTRTSPRTRKADCRWARRPTNGRTATSTRASRMPRWFSTRRLSHRTRAIRPSRPAVRWRIGRTAKSTFTRALRAPRKPRLPSRDG